MAAEARLGHDGANITVEANFGVRTGTPKNYRSQKE
jgi:hypothetical protein